MLQSKHNSRIKYIRRLASRRFREQEKKFIVEGVRFLEEALRENWPLELVMHTPEAYSTERTARLLNSLSKKNIALLTVEKELFNSLADTNSPQGVLGIAYMTTQFTTDTILQTADHDLLVLVDGVRDPGNLGTIIRCADASCADGVLVLKGSADPYNSKTLRSTMGSIFRVPLVQISDSQLLLNCLHQSGWHLIPGNPKATLLLPECDLTGPVVLVIGSEAHGVSAGILAAAWASVRIPMPGKAESLNAGIAAGIMLYEALRQRNTLPL